MKKISLLFLALLTLMSFRTDKLTNTFVLVVDAGHGGNDVGFTTNGIHEKEITLKIAQQIQAACKDKGLPVILTRHEDKYLELNERVSVSENIESGLFISIHINSDRHNDSRSGIECMIAEQNPDSKESKAFSEMLLQELKSLHGISVTSTKQSSVFLLTNNTIPTVILELGYLTNTSDLNFISNVDNQRNVADKIVSSVMRYKH